MNLLVIGTGYVGLVTGTCFAEMGHHVVCLDVDKPKIRGLQQGRVPFFEPGLEALVKRNVQAKRLAFTTSYVEGLSQSLVCFLAVPTPSAEDGSADLSYLEAALGQIASHMNDYKILVVKSTVPIGTGAHVKQFMQKLLCVRRTTAEFDVVSNPEFLKEGDAVQDFMKPDRVILGVDNPRVEALMRELYSPFTLSHERVIVMDIPSAEMTKYAANVMLATRVSLMNELAGLCELTGANICKVRSGIGADQRIGYKFLYPGVGYGGSCFPKDIRALKAKGESLGYKMAIITAADEVNNRQKHLMGKKVAAYFAEKGGLNQKTIALWGLAFKPETDDMREAPSLTLIEYLLGQECSLRLYDPVSMENTKKILGAHSSITWCVDEFDAASGADAVVLMTEWKQFRFVDFAPVLAKMKGHAFFDGRNQYKPADMAKKGFDYISIGKPSAVAAKK